jgi:O-methyltransferase involved in polyketide biosynthesis
MIPYAREAAALMQYPEPYEPDFSNPHPGFWIRVMHFEARYQSINNLLNDLSPQPLNILEISSGFSFRGLALAAEREVNYIDTDLPDVIATKQKMIDALATDTVLRGHYELRPLNALDTTAFQTIVDECFGGAASLVIVNEGLLMYLGKEEKQQLCRFIAKVLRERGGYWITADIYIRRSMPDDPELQQGDTLKEFLEKHKVQENMFESFEEATQLFADAGLVLDKEAEPDYANLSAAPHFMASASPELLGRLRGGGKIHATWRLRPA